MPIITLWYFGLRIAYLLIIPVGLHKWKRALRFFYYYCVFSLGGLIGRCNINIAKLLRNPLSMRMSSTILILTAYRLFRSQSAYLAEIHWGHISWATAYILSFIHLTFIAASKLKRFEWGERLSQLISRGSDFTYMFHRPLWSIMLIPLPITEGPITFIIQFLIGSPLVMYPSGKLQPLYDEVFVSRLKVSDKPSTWD